MGFRELAQPIGITDNLLVLGGNSHARRLTCGMGENRENSICSGYLPAVDWIDQAIPKLTWSCRRNIALEFQ